MELCCIAESPSCLDPGALRYELERAWERATGQVRAVQERRIKRSTRGAPRDPPGGIPGAGGVVGKAEIPGEAARRMAPSLSFV